MIALTVDDYMRRIGEVVGDITLTASADGTDLGCATAIGYLNMARRGVFRELLQAGIVESRMSEKVEITADSSDTDRLRTGWIRLD